VGQNGVAAVNEAARDHGNLAGAAMRAFPYNPETSDSIRQSGFIRSHQPDAIREFGVDWRL
jgi:hypothetical protein